MFNLGQQLNHIGCVCNAQLTYLERRHIVGSSPDWVKPKTIKLVYVSSPLSTQH